MVGIFVFRGLVRGEPSGLRHLRFKISDLKKRQLEVTNCDSKSTLKQAVRRNIDRFPDDFMFVLDSTEFEAWRSQFVTSKADRKGLRHPPMAFTEQGVAMLSSVLNSARAVQVNIAIMRTFVRLRQMLTSHADLRGKLAEMERKYDHQFKVVFGAIRQLMIPTEPKRKQIGFTKAKKK